MAWDIKVHYYILRFYFHIASYKSNKNILDFNWSRGKVSQRSKVSERSKVRISLLSPNKSSFAVQAFSRNKT